MKDVTKMSDFELGSNFAMAVTRYCVEDQQSCHDEMRRRREKRKARNDRRNLSLKPEQKKALGMSAFRTMRRKPETVGELRLGDSAYLKIDDDYVHIIRVGCTHTIADWADHEARGVSASLCLFTDTGVCALVPDNAQLGGSVYDKKGQQL